MKPQALIQRKNALLLAAVILMVAALSWSFYQWRGQRMSSNWMGPFLSAAQNLMPGQRVFLIDIDDVKHFKALASVAEEDAYVFRQSTILVPYIYDPIGYPYLIRAATTLFPFVGHQLAIILFQSLVHLILCYSLLSSQHLSASFRILFLVLYALNPLVLRFVTFNHYYFWQVIPSFWLLFISLKISHRVGWGVLWFVLPFVLLARPTTLFAVLVCIVYWYKFKSKKWAIGYTVWLALLGSWLYVPNQKNPWHTMYVGVGAYSNPYGINLSDDDAYALYEQHTGIPLNPSTGGNYFELPVQRQYRDITQHTFLTIWQDKPFLLLKNAVINFFGGFSIGYVNKAPDWLNYLVSFSGLLFVGVLWYFKKFKILLFVVLSMAGYVLYYPPIQAYMYGNYLLLVWGLIEVLEAMRRKYPHAVKIT
ncbi:hypothetical protein GCM10027275_30080 [Rhabdobacter roseus]|uniref:Glycosyltransferase RgtA/B/C/D-like domain-containing protein n=1 Tax=Rhabdobacter roseus TaxID=1655419 RepID=A0A840TPY5_9BACT|nr:hypothetical protein [Rhabdobacter roseus]MBB5284965.1 hypothetical protein [Rhabdobacter roseus]